MDDEGKLRLELDRANRAQSILDNELIKGFIEDMRAKVRRDFDAMPADNLQGLQRLAYRRDAVEVFVKSFEDHIRTGKFAATQLDQIERAKRR